MVRFLINRFSSISKGDRVMAKICPIDDPYGRELKNMIRDSDMNNDLEQELSEEYTFVENLLESRNKKMAERIHKAEGIECRFVQEVNHDKPDFNKLYSIFCELKNLITPITNRKEESNEE